MNIELNTYLVSNPIYHLVALVAARGVPIDHRMPSSIRHAGADQVCRIRDAHEAVARVLLGHDTEARRARIKVRAIQAFLNMQKKKENSQHPSLPCHGQTLNTHVAQAQDLRVAYIADRIMLSHPRGLLLLVLLFRFPVR